MREASFKARRADVIAYWVAVAPLAARLPAALAYRIACWRGDWSYRHLRSEMIPNLRQVLGDELGTKEAERLAREFYRLLSCEAIDVMRLRGKGRSLGKLVEIRGREHLDAALVGGKGAIVCSAHFGSYSSAFSLIHASGFPLTTIGRRQWHYTPDVSCAERRFWDFIYARRLLRHRQRPNIEPWPGRFQVAAQAAVVLRANEMVSICGDAPPQGTGLTRAVEVDFLGRTARLLPGVVILAQLTGAPILLVFMHRLADYRHQVLEISPPVPVQGEIEVALGRCVAAMDAAIKMDPAHWEFWPSTDDLARLGLLQAASQGGQHASVRNTASRLVMRVTVIGAGYLGAAHAACMAELGFDVLGVDIDPDRIVKLANGEMPFYELGLDELIRRHVTDGRLDFTTSFARAAEFGDVHFLCVGTPLCTGGSVDLSQVDGAVSSLAPHLRRSCLVVGKSTVPAGTARKLAGRIRDIAPADEFVEVSWNPEFLREGHAVADTLSPDRLVFGVQSDWAASVLSEVYAGIIRRHTPVVVTDIETAELIKLAANAFLATKISFVNGLSELCQEVGADVAALAGALAYDPRIGSGFLQSGAGFGGGCLPKDLQILICQAREAGVENLAGLLREVDNINARARRRLLDMTRMECGGDLDGQRVCVLGAAFKAHSDDVRDSPALAIASAIQREGAHVIVYDPQAMENAKRSHPAIEYASSVAEAVCHADVVLHLTEWPEFRDIDPAQLAGLVRRRCVIDGRLALDPVRWREAGWTYLVPGRVAGHEARGSGVLSTAWPIGGGTCVS